MKVLFFDLETTGLLDSDPEITEIAFALYDTAFKRILLSGSTLVAGEKRIPDDVSDLTGISNAARKTGQIESAALVDFGKMMAEADALFARNGVAFDVPILKKRFEKHGYEYDDMPCIDDTLDIVYPKKIIGRTLSHICADHGFVNPFPHNAMGDVLAMIRIMEIGEYDLDAAFATAKTPAVHYIAEISYRDRELAKKAGFRWHPERKIWYKRARRGNPPSVEFPVAEAH